MLVMAYVVCVNAQLSFQLFSWGGIGRRSQRPDAEGKEESPADQAYPGSDVRTAHSHKIRTSDAAGGIRHKTEKLERKGTTSCI